MNTAVELSKLTKKYGDITALDNITLSCEHNKIYGLLGRNGAGKTTLMQLMAGQLLPSEGFIHIFGEDVYENDRALAKVRYFGPFTHISNYVKTYKVKDLVNNASLFYPDWDQDFADRLTKVFSLDIKKSFRSLSTGMLSMVSIVISLASRTPITLLDEPYTGLDAAARQEFYDILAEDYSNNPRTIIFSTHLIDEASKLFEDVILLDKGQILLQQPLSTLEELSFTVTGDDETLKSMMSSKQVIHKEVIGRRGSYYIFDKLSEQEKTVLTRAGLEVRSLSLQQLFVYLTANREGTVC